MASSTPPAAEAAPVPDPLVQYVLVRRDLKWPTGALVSQGAHACVAALWHSRTRPETIEYADATDSMHTVTLSATSVDEVLAVADTLTSKGIAHYVWREQPENIVTALASAPGRKSALAPFFSAFKLLR